MYLNEQPKIRKLLWQQPNKEKEIEKLNASTDLKSRISNLNYEFCIEEDPLDGPFSTTT